MRYSRFYVLSQHQAAARYVAGKLELPLALVYSILLDLQVSDNELDVLVAHVHARAPKVRQELEKEAKDGSPKPRRRKR